MMEQVMCLPVYACLLVVLLIKPHRGHVTDFDKYFMKHTYEPATN